MKKINEVAKAGLGSALSTKALLVFTVLVISVLLQQASSVSSQPSPITTRGAVVVGNAGYFEAANFFHVNISRYVATSGDFILSNITSKLAVNRPVTVSVQGADLLSFEEGFPATFNLSLSNFTINKTLLPNGSMGGNILEVNKTWKLVNGTNWVSLDLSYFNKGSVTTKGTTIQNFLSGELRQFRIRPKAPGLSGRVEYSILLNTTVSGQQVTLDFDPVLTSGLVSYWDMSGSGYNTPDISGNGYNGALGSSGATLKTSGSNLSVDWLSLDGSNGFWTRSDIGEVWHGLEAGLGTFCMWFNTTDTDAYIIQNLVSDAGNCGSESPIVVRMGTANNYFWKGYIASRNNIDLNSYANNVWHQLCHVTNNSGDGFLYIDAVPVGNKPLFTNACTAASGRNLTLGCYFGAAVNTSQCDAGTYWTAGLDEVAMWNRSFDQNDVRMLYYNGTNGTFCTGNPCNWGGAASSSANESQGDTAIEAGINSSLTSATKYSSQQAYVRNLTNNQTLGRFDWIASSGSQRWLINYITTGESYIRASNLTTAVYVLEITDKTSAQITDEVGKFINTTKSS